MSSSGSGLAIAGIHEIYTFNPTVTGGTQVGDRFVAVNAPVNATNTAIGKIIRMIDNTNFTNTVRGIEVTASGGNNTNGVNTGIRSTGHTFGIQGITTGLAGGTTTSAALYGENSGTTQGDILRLYTSTMTTATSMAQFYQESSTFTGTGLLMNLGAGTGIFSGNFLDLQANGNSRFKVTSSGTTTIGQLNQTATSAGLIIGYGGLCVDNDGFCFASTTGRISAVSYTTGSTDLAENYFSSTTLDVGDIVMSAGGETITLGMQSESKRVLGIISTKPGIILGLDEHTPLTGEYPVALSGRVPVKVSLSGGVIKIGDRITLSSVPGVGMKANSTSSATVAVALENWSGDASFLDTAQEGKVLAFVNLAYTDLNKHISGSQIDLTSSTTGELVPLFALSDDGTDVRYLADRPLNFSSSILTNVKAIFSSTGKWSINEEGKLTVEEVSAKTVRASERLEVGTPTNRTGVTLYDETDGSPYCIKMVATVLRSIAGTCDNPSGITPASGGMHESTPPPPPTANGLSEVPADTGSTTLPVDADSISTDEEGAINSPLPQTGNDVSEILADTGSLTLPADTDSIATGEEGAMTPP
jgi:hypothetical protein